MSQSQKETFFRLYAETGNATEAYRLAFDCDSLTKDALFARARRLLSKTVAQGENDGSNRHEQPLPTVAQGKNDGSNRHEQPSLTVAQGETDGSNRREQPSLTVAQGKNDGSNRHEQPSPTVAPNKNDGSNRHRAESHSKEQVKQKSQPTVIIAWEILNQFKEAMTTHGLIPPAQILADGLLHRCDAGGVHGKGDGAYILFLDDCPAGGMQDWRDDRGWINWRANIGRAYTPEEEKKYRAKVAEMRRKKEEEVANQHQRVQQQAVALWEAADEASANRHPYLERKGVGAHGVRINAATWKRQKIPATLLIPLRDWEGTLWSLQVIFPAKDLELNRDRDFMFEGRKTGLFHRLGRIDDQVPLLVAEGYATGATLHELTGWPVLVTFDSGNLKPVALEARKRHPTIDLVLAADNDRFTLGNPGLGKANEAALLAKARVVFPHFEEHETGSDWNDWAGLRESHEALGTEMAALFARPVPNQAATEDAWIADIVMGRSGPRPNQHNVFLVLSRHSALTGMIKLDEFRQVMRVCKRPPWYDHESAETYPRDWTDIDSNMLAGWLTGKTLGAMAFDSLSDSFTYNSAKSVADRHRYHPVRDHLSALRWDGQERLSTWLNRYFGVEDTLYSGAVGRAWLISAVARVFRPGCKADGVLTLVGDQGQLKSSGLRILGGEWFDDSAFGLETKDSFVQLQGSWIYELAELSGMTKADVERTKAFISSATDKYRPPYGHAALQFPRQVVFAATTNTPDFLKDSTGNRRFWPVTVGGIDLDGLTLMRNQIFAEAVVAFQAGEHWWLTPEVEAIAHGVQKEFTQEDPWEPTVVAYLLGRSSAIMTDMLFMIEPNRGNWSNNTRSRIDAILTKVSWKKHRIRTGTGRERVYVPVGSAKSGPPGPPVAHPLAHPTFPKSASDINGLQTGPPGPPEMETFAIHAYEYKETHTQAMPAHKGLSLKSGGPGGPVEMTAISLDFSEKSGGPTGGPRVGQWVGHANEEETPMDLDGWDDTVF